MKTAFRLTMTLVLAVFFSVARVRRWFFSPPGARQHQNASKTLRRQNRLDRGDSNTPPSFCAFAFHLIHLYFALNRAKSVRPAP